MNEPERRRFLRTALAGAGLALAGSAAGQETTTAGEETNGGDRTTTADGETATSDGEETTNAAPDADAGLVTVSSTESVGATVERIEEDIEDNDDLILVTTVDHAGNARNAGLDLRPTTLILFGNPNLGTQLMQASRTAGIDLPQKLLVWAAEDGTANVTYNDPQWLAERHDIEGQEDVVGTIAAALESLATGR
ncbi:MULTISPECIES: DUF302 domain-containing protein [Halorussus]|uniref:DUF302 domain-containing protein n=1 Tax=Halorussus TaxID=1070314 RepID=UPI000E214F1A|nr:MULTISPECIES: DUF302 domain-containing protein [Halorussus]NHN59992.1 DUF302 domain-containing protein [Halorussus sp. JP-T4]